MLGKSPVLEPDRPGLVSPLSSNYSYESQVTFLSFPLPLRTGCLGGSATSAFGPQCPFIFSVMISPGVSVGYVDQLELNLIFWSSCEAWPMRIFRSPKDGRVTQARAVEIRLGTSARVTETSFPLELL